MTESPKALFLQIHKESAEKMCQLCQDRPLRLAIPFAISMMVYNGASKEQLDGAKAFATILMTLGEPISNTPTFPVKELHN